MKKEKDIERLIASVSLPNTNSYYENESADGFAFLGAAREIVGLNSEECYMEVIKRNYTLNAKRTIAPTGAIVDENTQYVYTLWSCIELFSLLKDEKKNNLLCKTVDEIGKYENGMMRYCTTEIRYLVPNVTSAAAYIYSINGEYDKAAELIEVLEKEQCRNGNWQYKILDKQTNKPSSHKYEDSHHLAMMIYHLREVARLVNIKTDQIVNKALLHLAGMNKIRLQAGTIGWGIPWLYLATNGIDLGLSKRAYDETISKSILNPNFRTRGVAAFCLAKGTIRG